ncbi:metallophosphoesterase [Methylobacterium symbioticum]|uniref:3',5'-cyclic adenosine monophosphate phosphodiesterase CpdA n=2 Tax=Methylobacterium TaxID=407 RepID=A0A509EMB3_9HYPH|nr:metallophosphoesterase [Methylobacterium symbioticum]VUD74834.1 3',5'-cyclic adenosine monophosphate phosphodiesterase CpdA [Methylobacterium symbioticum]
MIRLIPSLPALYVVARVVWPSPWPLALKLGLTAFLLAASQYHLWSRLSSGSVFAPEFPRPVVILFNVAFGALALAAPMLVALDVVTLVCWILPGDGWTVPMGWRYAAALAALVLAAVAVSQAVRVPPLKDVTVAIPDLPRGFEGYTILHLSDLHISRLFPAEWAETVVARANALGTDLIAVTGDFIDGSLAARRTDVEPLRGLTAPDGVWAVPGNHEYFFDYDAWMGHLAGLGIRLLANAHTVLTRDGGALVVAGVTDRSALSTGHPRPDLAAALAGAPAGAPVVLLDHQPASAARAAAYGVRLQLSGHTHGGMIRGLDRLVARGNAGFVSGAYRVQGMLLYVSNGTALWPGFALRLGRPSELTRIILRRSA